MGTDYNNRVEECKVASWLLHELSNDKVPSFRNTKLRDISKDIYVQYESQLPGRFRRRARHYFTEQDRVKAGLKAWQDGDLITFGKLMTESGESSVFDYESGCPELITIFNILKETKVVYGARFSGAGYRGCCIGLIDPKYKDEIKKRIDDLYPNAHPTYKDIYKVSFAKMDDGSRYVDLSKEND